jgi:hypothetical protein
MRIEKNEKIQDILSFEGRNDEYLERIFKFETWYFKDAINFLLGFYKSQPYNIENANQLIALNGLYLEEPENSDLFLYLSIEQDWLYDIWLNSGYPERNSPEFYLRWAKDIGCDVDWLDHAERIGLLKSKPENKLAHKGEINPRLEDNYLRLIFALCNEMKEFSPNDSPNKIAKLIKSNTKIKLDIKTLATYITKAKGIYYEDKDSQGE